MCRPPSSTDDAIAATTTTIADPSTVVVVVDAEKRTRRRPFSTFVTACFTLNYVMGTGILSLPWALHEAGVVLTCACLTAVCVVAVVTVDYLLTVMARAEAVAEHHEREQRRRRRGRLGDSETTPLARDLSATRDDDDDDDDTRSTVESENVDDEESPESSSSRPPRRPRPPLAVGDRKFEIADLCRVFLGPAGERAFASALVLLLCGALWAYSTVFGKAMTLSLPIPGLDADACYVVYVSVFATIVVPLSLLELSEQVTVQVFLSTCRFVMILILAVTPPWVAWYSRDDGSSSSSSCRVSFGGQTAPASSSSSSWNPSGVPSMLPAAVFAVIFHHSLPGLAAECVGGGGGDDDGRAARFNLHRVFGLTLALCMASYAAVGAIDSWFFGDDIEQSVNLNWSDLRYECDDEEDRRRFSLAYYLAPLVSFYTVVFPAVDVVSAFPLNAIVLSSNLRTVVLSSSSSSSSSSWWWRRSKKEEEEKRGAPSSSTTLRSRVDAFKMISCLPPVVGALFVRDLGTVTDLTGLVGFAVAFCFPALLYERSDRRMRELGLTTRTRYQRLGSSSRAARTILVFGAAVTVYTCWGYYD